MQLGQTPDEQLLSQLKRVGTEVGYHIQLDGDIPTTIRNEISRWTSHRPPSLLINITSASSENCIEDVFIRELTPPERKGRIGAIPFFKFLRWFFDVTSPQEAVLIYHEGAERQWFPMDRYTISLDDFLRVLYDYATQAGYASGVYTISPQAHPFDFRLLGR